MGEKESERGTGLVSTNVRINFREERKRETLREEIMREKEKVMKGLDSKCTSWKFRNLIINISLYLFLTFPLFAKLLTQKSSQINLDTESNVSQVDS